MEADFGARINKYTVQSSSSAGPLVDTLPFSVDIVIWERIRSAASPEPAAALQAVTEYVSLSQPTTCTPPVSCGCTCSTAASDFVSVFSSDRTTASRSSNWMRRSEQSVIGCLWPPEMFTEWRCEAALALVRTMRASRAYAEIRKARLRLDIRPLPAAIDDGSRVWSRRLLRFQSIPNSFWMPAASSWDRASSLSETPLVLLRIFPVDAAPAPAESGRPHSPAKK